jgi:transcriptional regulator with XRE-family HTH domain
MSLMLEESAVRKIEAKLRAGQTQRAVARELGVARKTVSRVARGKAAIRQRHRRQAARQARESKEIRFRRVEPYYCFGCETDVFYSPCPRCQAVQQEQN